MILPHKRGLCYRAVSVCGPVADAVVQLVEYRTRNQEVADSIHTGPLQATLSKLLTYCVLGSTQPPTLSGMGNE